MHVFCSEAPATVKLDGAGALTAVHFGGSGEPGLTFASSCHHFRMLMTSGNGLMQHLDFEMHEALHYMYALLKNPQKSSLATGKYIMFDLRATGSFSALFSDC